MVLKIEQTTSNFKSKFVIKENDKIEYLAGTPWLNLALPLNIDRKRRCILTSPDETICYILSYNLRENILNSLIPMKWIFTKSQKKLIFDIYDKDNNKCGKFYKLINGFLDTKFIIEFGNYNLTCYEISVGKTQNIFILNEGKQIAEIVKPLNVVNNLDNYYLYLLDEYSELKPIISFFTVLFDYEYYSNQGEVASKEELSVSYTYDKNSKLYNKNWLTDNFKEEAYLMDNEIIENRKTITKNLKNHALIIISLFIISILLVFVILKILS